MSHATSYSKLRSPNNRRAGSVLERAFLAGLAADAQSMEKCTGSGSFRPLLTGHPSRDRGEIATIHGKNHLRPDPSCRSSSRISTDHPADARPVQQDALGSGVGADGHELRLGIEARDDGLEGP